MPYRISTIHELSARQLGHTILLTNYFTNLSNNNHQYIMENKVEMERVKAKKFKKLRNGGMEE